ncbi:MAG: hypothetical protein QOI55_230 [Actinomycetota bacterium]|nr:hypothetical protein [Actinomycetota bacterium]
MRVAQLRSQCLVRGFAVALFACAPVLAMTAPALGDTAVVDPPTDTTTTVPVDTTTTAPNPPPETLPEVTTVPPDTTVTVPVTAPATDPPIVDPSTSPSSTPASTDPTTGTTTDTSTPPNSSGSPPPIGTPPDPPAGGGSTGSGTTGGTAAAPSGTKTNPSHDASPAHKLFQLVAPQPLYSPTASSDTGTLTGNFASLRYPAAQAKDVMKNFAKAGKTISASLMSPFNSQATRGVSWTDIGSAAPRFGPWIVLLAMAWLVRMVIASMLADRTAGPRRRRWTLL